MAGHLQPQSPNLSAQPARQVERHAMLCSSYPCLIASQRCNLQPSSLVSSQYALRGDLYSACKTASLSWPHSTINTLRYTPSYRTPLEKERRSYITKWWLTKARDGYKYFWINTCCTNKVDLIELSTAINSYTVDINVRRRATYISLMFLYQWRLLTPRAF